MPMSRHVLIITCAAMAAAAILIAAIAAAQTAPPATQQAAPPAAAAPRPQQAPAVSPPMPPSLPPYKEVDLTTPEGAALFGAQWKTMVAKIVEGPAIARSKDEFKTSYDIQPHAGEAGFDDSEWPVIEPKSLTEFRGGGKIAFIWYRAKLKVPEKIGDFNTAGSIAVLAVCADDYGEVWVNGGMPRRVGIPSPATIQGFNIPNRVVLTEGVKPGDEFQVAIFAINGPISAAPSNWVFLREAKVEFYRNLSSFR
jgi:gluconolactonase